MRSGIERIDKIIALTGNTREGFKALAIRNFGETSKAEVYERIYFFIKSITTSPEKTEAYEKNLGEILTFRTMLRPVAHFYLVIQLGITSTRRVDRLPPEEQDRLSAVDILTDGDVHILNKARELIKNSQLTNSG